jgi:hypothetical protein
LARTSANDCERKNENEINCHLQMNVGGQA